jgi:uncharacterized protein involved in exopolysaccharide biosynthesis
MSRSSQPFEDSGDVLGDLYLTIWTCRKPIALVMALCTSAALLYAFLAQPTYSASVTLMPQVQVGGGELFGRIASLTGATLPAQGSSEELYKEIAVSDLVLDQLLEETWEFEDHHPISLYEAIGLDADAYDSGPIEFLDFEAKRILRGGVIKFSRDLLTGFMVLTVRVPENRHLPAQIANKLVVLLDDYNRNVRKSNATEQRVFIEQRLQIAKAELDSLEGRLARFADSNRSYATSPSLALEYHRIERVVMAQNTVWVELRRQLELAKIDENKNMVTIDVLDWATTPVKRASPRRKFILAVGVLLGLVGSALFLLLRTQWSVYRTARDGVPG